jgi:hypothetical protein
VFGAHSLFALTHVVSAQKPATNKNHKHHVNQLIREKQNVKYLLIHIFPDLSPHWLLADTDKRVNCFMICHTLNRKKTFDIPNKNTKSRQCLALANKFKIHWGHKSKHKVISPPTTTTTTTVWCAAHLQRHLYHILICVFDNKRIISPMFSRSFFCLRQRRNQTQN